MYKKLPALATLLGVSAIIYIAQKAVEYLLSFFIYEKFDWTPASFGTLGIFIGLVLVGIQGGLIRYTIPKFGQQKNVIAGLIFYVIGLLLVSLASKGWNAIFVCGTILFRRHIRTCIAGPRNRQSGQKCTGRTARCICDFE